MEISMSAIPALTVIACMGICIDLTALVTLFFCAGKGTHDERIANALKCVFIPTLDSMMSTIVGCFALAFSVIENLKFDSVSKMLTLSHCLVSFIIFVLVLEDPSVH